MYDIRNSIAPPIFVLCPRCYTLLVVSELTVSAVICSSVSSRTISCNSLTGCVWQSTTTCQIIQLSSKRRLLEKSTTGICREIWRSELRHSHSRVISFFDPYLVLSWPYPNLCAKFWEHLGELGVAGLQHVSHKINPKTTRFAMDSHAKPPSLTASEP